MDTRFRTIFIHLSISWWLIFPIDTFGQYLDLKFHHFNVQNGLPSNTIHSIFKDSRGFLWIATENGLSRFDGYSFTTFRSSDYDTLDISSNLVMSVYEDRLGRLWVGSEKGLDLFNRDMEYFDRHYFKDVPVRAIYQDENNLLWIGNDRGLFLLDESNGTFIKFFPSLFSPGQPYNAVQTICEDNAGLLWVGTMNNGLFVCDIKNKSFIHYAKGNSFGSLQSDDIKEIIKDSQNRIWIATYGGGLHNYQPDTKTFKVFRHDPKDDNSIASDLILSIWEDDDGKMWIGTDGAGLNIFEPERNIFHQIIHSQYNSKSISNNVIDAIYGDSEGGMWFGSYIGGLNYYNKNAEAFIYYVVPTFSGSSSVTSFAEDKSGNLWIGTDGGGLSYFDRNSNQFENFHFQEDDAASLSSDKILSLQFDHNGILWIGTYLGGVCIYNPDPGRFDHFTSGDNILLENDVIWCILEDSKNRLFFGTNRGLIMYDTITKKFKILNISNSNLSCDPVRSLYEDSKGRIWVGTQEGVNILEKGDTSFTVIKSNENKNLKLSNDWIKTIIDDNQGGIWLGTIEGGINYYDEKNNTIKIIKESDGLPNNNIASFLIDKKSNFWIGTKKGLAWLNRKTLDIKNYGPSEGLLDHQFNNNSCYKTQKGEFLFGGLSGFVLFKPEDIMMAKRNTYPPPVVITDFKIFNKKVIPKEAGSPLTKCIGETEEVVLSYKQHALTFEFTTLNFIQPENNQYAYRLLGFEEEWNHVGRKRSATYTNLRPGKYIFQVKASNNAGVWNETGTSISVIITPPFWQTWWFRVLTMVLFIAIVLFVFFKVKKRIEEKIRISRLISELKIKALVTQMNPHFIFNCLTSIQELILMKKPEDAMHYLNQFSILLRTILHGSENNLTSLDQELVLLESYLVLESLRFDGKFHYDIKVDENIDTEEIYLPSFLIQPFVENALWHGLMHKKDDRHLVISFSIDEQDELVCKIDDNGIGRQQAARINKNRKSHHSLGIKIIKERLKLMSEADERVDLQIIDKMDDKGSATGTRVIIKLPESIRDQVLY